MLIPVHVAIPDFNPVDRVTIAEGDMAARHILSPTAARLQPCPSKSAAI